MITNSLEYAEEMYMALCFMGFLNKEGCVKYMAQHLQIVYDAAYKKGVEQPSASAQPPIKSLKGLGIPCSACGSYYSASLEQCPSCKTPRVNFTA